MFLRRQRFVVENDGGVRSETAGGGSRLAAARVRPACPVVRPSRTNKIGRAVRGGSGARRRRAARRGARAPRPLVRGRRPCPPAAAACVPGPVRDEGFPSSSLLGERARDRQTWLGTHGPSPGTDSRNRKGKCSDLSPSLSRLHWFRGFASNRRLYVSVLRKQPSSCTLRATLSLSCTSMCRR